MENKINAMYDELYKKKQSELEKAKNNSLNELNQQKADGEVEYYNEKNKSSLANQKNTQAIRDYMARNNLLNSGENADAILRNRTDYANDIGRINSDHRNFNNNIERQKTKLNSDYNYDIATAKSDYEAQKQKALMDYKLQQQQLAAAYSRSSGGSSGSGSGLSEKTLTNSRTTLANEVNKTVNTMSGFTETRNLVEAAYLQGIISSEERSNYLTRITNSLNGMKKAQASVNKGTYGTYNKNGLTGTIM
jgi:hypothetical protein